MAQAFPSLILDTVLEKLKSPIFRSKNLGSRFRIQLEAQLELIKEVINDAEWMAFLFPRVVRVCESVCKLQCLLYELDDILGEAQIRRMPVSGGMVEKARLLFYSMPFHLTLDDKLKSISMRLDCIVKEWYERNLIIEEPAGQPQTSTAMGGSRQKPVVRKGIIHYDPDYVNDDEFQMIGREDDKQEVIAMLSDEDFATTVCITGDVAVGKTTLCRAIYIDEEVRSQFDIRLWVRLEGASDCCSIIFWKKIITTLIRPDEANLYLETEDEDQLTDKIVSLIAGRKTLLVLDSFPRGWRFVGKADHNLQGLQGLIAKCHKGNKILFSSPPRVESYPQGTHVHGLFKRIPKEHLWSIFEKNAFVLGHDKAGQSAAEWKIAMGKQIVNRSGGYPGLLKCVGSLLYGKDDTDLWEYFAGEFNFKTQYLRYDAASQVCESFPKSQQSVGYLSLFSKHEIKGPTLPLLLGNEIKVRTLMNQLVAHGFRNSSNVGEVLEFGPFAPSTSTDKWDADATCLIPIGEQYQIQLLSKGEAAILEWTEKETNVPKAARHVSIVRPSSMHQSQQRSILPHSLIKDAIHRRTLLFLGELCPVRLSTQTLEMLAANLRYLRVLDLHDLGLKMLPSSIGNLICLKYLDLSRNDFRVLPRLVCRLKHLWTLKLIYCDKLIKIPRHIKSLNQLKNLEVSMCFDLNYMPSSIILLTSLESLDRFVVCPRKGGLRYLRNLDNLKGKLSIELPRQWERSTTDAEEAKLERKVGITTLEFKWQGAANGDEDNDDYDVLENLKPFNSIKNLLINRFGGRKLASWITSLDLLTQITISQCTRCEILPPLHRLPHLTSLTLTSMNMEYLQDNKNGDESCLVSSTSTLFFPNLKILKIGIMPNLKGWWPRGMEIIGGELSRIPIIDNLEIWNCPSLTMMLPFSFSESWKSRLIIQHVYENVLQLIRWRPIKRVVLISIKDMVFLPSQLVINSPHTLLVQDCHQLQMLLENEVTGVGACTSLLGGFPDLEILKISKCPVLKHLSTGLRLLTNLRRLTISKCSEELDCLYKEDEGGMPWKSLQKLTTLKVKGFDNMVALPKGIQHLCVLNKLVIKDCKALKHMSSSLRHLSNLDHLKIFKCSEELDCLCKEEEEEMPWKALHKLKTLTIGDFENLVALPKDLHDLHQFHPIYIANCKALKWEEGIMKNFERDPYTQNVKEMVMEGMLVSVS